MSGSQKRESARSGTAKRPDDSEILSEGQTRFLSSVVRSAVGPANGRRATFVVRLGVPGNGSRRNGGKFLRNCWTHNECKVFCEARGRSMIPLADAPVRRSADRRSAINFRRRENSAREPGSSTGGSRGHTVRDSIGSPLNPFAVWARVRAPTRARTFAREREKTPGVYAILADFTMLRAPK